MTIVTKSNSPFNVSSGTTSTGDVVVSGGSMFVLSGGTADTTRVSSGGFLTVDSGGKASGTVLVGGTSSAKIATEIVSAGGTDLGAQLSSGGEQKIFGITSGATVFGGSSFGALGGLQIIESGGTESGTTVSSGGTLELLGGATADGFVISSGGSLEIASGYVLKAYQVTSAITLDVVSGGTASGTIVTSAGTENVSDGGTDIGAQLSADAEQFVYGSATSTTVFNGGTQNLDSGGTASGTTISSGGTQIDADGFGDTGTAIGTTIANSGLQQVGFFTAAQGTAISTIIESGGTQEIGVEGGGGTALSTTIAGGRQYVGYEGGFFGGAAGNGRAVDTTILSGTQFVGFSLGSGLAIDTTISGGEQVVGDFGSGTARNTVIESGGLQWVGYVSGTGVASSTIIENGGTQNVGFAFSAEPGKGKAISTTIDSGGTENVVSGGTIVSTTISGGTLTVGSGAVISGGITFAGSGGTLDIEATTMPTNVISGLAIGDVIDLSNVAFSAGGSVTLEAGNILKVVEGGKTYNLHLNPSQNLSADFFTPSLDVGSGTKIVVSPNPAAPKVVSATSTDSGAYGIDRTVTFTLDTSLPAVVSGAPTLTLNDGGIASYVSGSGTDKLTFNYTVGSGQNAAQLTTALSTLSGGTIEGLTGTPVSASTTPIKLATLGANTTMVPGGSVKLSANTEAALQAAIDIAAPGETIDPTNITLTSALIIPTGTDVTINGFGGGTGTFDAMQLNTTQPIIVEAGASAVFSYVDIKFKEELGDGADGGDGDDGDAGTAGANGNPPGQAGAIGTFGGDGGDGGGGTAGLSLLGAIQNYGNLTLNQVAIVADSTAGGGGGGGDGGKGGAGGAGGSGAGGYSGGGGAGAAGGDAGTGGTGGGGALGGTAVGGIYNAGSLTLEDTLVTGSATGGDGGDGGDGADGADGGKGGNGGPGDGGAGGGAGHGGNAGDGGNGGGGAAGGAAVGGILNVGTLNVVGATAVLFGDSANGGNGGNGGDAGKAGTVGNAGTPGTGNPNGATSLPGTAANDGADGADGTDGSSVDDLSGATTSGSVTIDHHMYEFDPKSLNPASVTLSSAGNKFTYEVDKYGPSTGGSVQWQVVAGPGGPAPQDFVGVTSGTLNFTGTTTAQTISFSVKPDLSEALNESFTIELSSPAAGDVLGTNSEIVQNVTNLNIDIWKAGTSADWSTTSDWSIGQLPISNTQAVIASGGTAISTASDDPAIASIVVSHGATLDVSGGTFTAKIGTGTGVNSGAVIVANGATLELGGTFVNAGSVTLDGAANPTQLELGGSLALSGGGKVILSDSADNAIVTNGSAATLTNAGNAITGAGTIGDAHLTLVNSGIIDANIGLPLNIDTAAFTNAGTLEATSAGGLVIHSNVNNSKTIEALGTGATVTIASTVSNTATGLILASGNGARVQLDGAVIAGGTLRTSGTTAVIETVSGTTNTMAGATVAGGSLVEVTSGTKLTISGGTVGAAAIVETTIGGTAIVSGTLTNSGTLFASGSGSLVEIASSAVVNGGVAKIGNGVVDIQGASSEKVTFQAGGSGGLQLDGLGSAYRGEVTGFGPPGGGNDTQYIDFADVAYTTGLSQIAYTSANATNTSGTLTVTNGGSSASVTLVGHYVTSDFQAEDIGGSLAIIDPTTYITTAVTIANGKSLVASAGDIIAQSTVNNGGTFEAENGNNIDVFGALTNSSTGVAETSGTSYFNVESSVTNSGLLAALSSSDFTIQGALTNGSMGTINDAASAIMSVEGPLTNSGTVLAAGAFMYVNGNITNYSLIDAGANNDTFLDDLAGGSGPTLIINNGTIEADNNATIFMAPGNNTANTGIINRGVIKTTGSDSSITLQAPGNNTANYGTIEADGGYVNSNAGVNNWGSIEAGGNGRVNLERGALFNGPFGSTFYSVDNIGGSLNVTGFGFIQVVGDAAGGSANIDGTGSIHGYVADGTPIDGIEFDDNSNVNVSFGTGDTGLLALNGFTDANGDLNPSNSDSNPNYFSGNIAGFTLGDGILTNLLYSDTDYEIFENSSDSSGGQLIVGNNTSNSNIVVLNLSGVDPGTGQAYTDSNFDRVDDNGFLLIEDPAVTQQQPGNAPANVGDDEIFEINTSDSGNVAFTGTTGKVVLDQPSTFTGTVTGFGAQNAIDLINIGFDANTTLGFSENKGGTGGTLTVMNGTRTAAVALLGNYMASSFAIAFDGHGGTLITDAPLPGQPPPLTPPHA